MMLITGGCQTRSRPRLRISDFFGNPWGMRYADPNDLGRHCLDYCHSEKLGLVYTCQAGFIDIGHVREAADRTHYLTQLTYENLMQAETDFSYRVIEPTRYTIAFGYPDHWKNLPREKKESIAREISIQLGQYLAHTSLIWHEILTWYGFSSSGPFPEKISAFSCEDPYSDVLGTHLAASVLSNPAIIDETLKQLEVQPPETAKQAVEKIKGDWYEGGYYFFVEIKKRNLDVGLDDGIVFPCRVDDICLDTPAQDCSAPNFSFLDEYEFKIRVRLKPVEFEKVRIYKTLGLKWSDRITPYIHFPMLLESIRKTRAKE
ncbi:MAG: DUF4056 domain-containing protein [Planctomycetota bacterium]|jgi:hypothetical protein